MAAQTEDLVMAPHKKTAYLDEMNARCMNLLGFDAIITLCETGDFAIDYDSPFDVKGLMVAYGVVSGNPERWMNRSGDILRRELAAMSERNGGAAIGALAVIGGDAVFWSTGKALAILGWIGHSLTLLEDADEKF